MADRQPIRYAQVGLGGRHALYREALTGRHAGRHRLVALCDANPGRLALAREAASAALGVDVPGWPAGGFDAMLRETRPDCVVVTTMDSTHDDYICRAMDAGCDVITEKPMTIDADRCRRILDTQARTGRSLRVTFNYRYSPPRTQVKHLLREGAIGDVLSVDFHWMLDVHHGADYFRRWHRHKACSGGLMVHKATHHFDLVNWWLATVPERVYASGARRYYRPETAEGLGLAGRSERCHTCPVAAACPFHLDLAANPALKQLYLDQERHDGYFRDRCVFSEAIDIEDSMHLTVDYRNGVTMSYSLNAFMPWEGYRIVFNGTRGRLEHTCQESVYINADGSVPGALDREGTWIRLFPHREPAYAVEVWEARGGHGGGDENLLEDLFGEGPADDPYGRQADHRAGAWSILTGIAANRSMAAGGPVRVADLLPGLAAPNYGEGAG